MIDTETDTSGIGTPRGGSGDDAGNAPMDGDLCRGFAEMGRRTMGGWMPDCCRPEQSDAPQ